MTALLKSIHAFTGRCDRRAERFAFRHPHLASFAMLIGLPLLALAAVSACTTAAVLPLALVFGWLPAAL